MRRLPPESLVFAVPWDEPGDWVWSSDPATLGGKIVPLSGPGIRGLREIRSALRARNHLRNCEVVFTWEMRSALAVSLALGRHTIRPKRVAVAPVVKGLWSSRSHLTSALLARADRVVWMSSWEQETWPKRLHLETVKMLVDCVPGARPTVQRPTPDLLQAAAPLIAIGNSRRDWQTLAWALETISEPATVVAAGRNRLPPKLKAGWTGSLPENQLLELLSASGIHLLSLSESDHACGQATLVRALMAGIPTVATDLPVLSEYFPDVAVARVPATDPGAIVDAVQRWRSNPELWGAAREDAFRFAVRFEHAPFARRMAQIANDIVT